MIDGATAAGLKGITAALNSAADNAEKIAALNADSGGQVQALVGLILNTHQVEAATKVIQTSDEMQQSVLNIAA